MAVRFWIAVPTLAVAGALAAYMTDSRLVALGAATVCGADRPDSAACRVASRA